jgi:hypothetical protein
MAFVDNLQFVEQRGFNGPNYDEMGNTFTNEQQLQMWIDLLEGN